MNTVQPVFSFELPTRIVFGAGSSKNLFEEMNALKASRPLIVTDKGVKAAGIVDKVLAGLPGDIKYQIFDDVDPNPKDINVAAGAKSYKEFGADSIIAIGGGSPIDCAKAIGVLAANNATDIKAYEGKNVPSKPLPALICIPTTSGTGSEVTFSSVINDTGKNYKMTVKNPYTAPKTAICDSSLTLSVPAHITAATGVDALTHAIEAFTATCAEPISDAAALYAIELIYDNLKPAFEDGSNLKARDNMLMGSMLAGIAFSHSDVASVHCIAESLGGMYDLPHGTCNAIFLPYMMEYCMDYCEKRYARVAKAMGLSFNSDKEGAKAAVEAVKQLAKDVALPSFASLNVNPSDYQKIAAASAKNISTESNPRPMKEEDYMAVLEMAHRG
ncbi:MAG: iron-containing alcohol dehydrogenase [Defluviitaleaceae bacterium]|nr:iron-containing alcohol dehydrogenase [Defluviitaleaceae bacterium]